MKIWAYFVIAFVSVHKIESLQMDFRPKMKLKTSNSFAFYENSCKILSVFLVSGPLSPTGTLFQSKTDSM